MQTIYSHAFMQSPPRQRGVALFVVIVFVMMSMLLALWGSRTSMFNEMLVGNDADYQRAFEAAQALLQDAELDIRLGDERSDSALCTAGGDLCRIATVVKIPVAQPSKSGSVNDSVTSLLAALDVQPAKCLNALCVKRPGRQDFWNTTSATTLQNGEVTLADMTQPDVGARYGRYTGAAKGSASNPANPLLQWDAATPGNQGGWYWIEIMKYDKSSEFSGIVLGGRNDLLPLKLDPNVVYRITALAYGRKPGTMVVLQQTYARQGHSGDQPG